MVVIHHAVLMSPLYESASRIPFGPGFWSNPIAWFKSTPLALLVSGQSAVTLFFILSGFVLALSLERVDLWSYKPYVIKRISRIYVPFFFAILTAAVGWYLVRPTPQPFLSDWFNELWTLRSLTASVLAAHLAMTGTEMWLDSPMWSLVHEMRISLIFPIVAWAVMRRPGATLIVLGAFYFGLLVFLERVQNAPFSSAIDTIRITFVFAVGAWAYFNRTAIGSILTRAHPAARLLGLGAACLAMMYPLPFLLTPLVLLGSLVLLSLAIGDPIVRSLLEMRVPLWLGRISYSLYLTHLITFNVIAFALRGRLPYWPFIIAAFISSFVVAELVNRAVEKPAMQLGKRLAGPSVGGGV